MASCSRAGARWAAGSRRASTPSMRACTPPIHAWNSLSRIFIGLGSRYRRASNPFQGLQDFTFQHLDLLLRRLQLLLAEPREFQSPLVRGERLFEGKLAAFHARDDFFELGKRLFEVELVELG